MIKSEKLLLDNIHFNNKEVLRVYLGGADNLPLNSNNCIVYKNKPAYNLLLNSDFRKNYENWNKSSIAVVDTTKAIRGRYSIKLEQHNVGSYNWLGITQDAISNNNPALKLKAGTTVTFSVYVYTDDLSIFDAPAGGNINFFKNSNISRVSWIYFNITPTKENEWQLIIFLTTIPADIDYVGVYIYLTLNGRLWINSPKLEIGEIAYPEWMPAAYEMIPNIFPSSYLNIENEGYKTNACKLSNLIKCGNNQARARFISTYIPNKSAGYFSVSFWTKTITGEARISCDINDIMLPLKQVLINDETWTFYSSTVYVPKFVTDIYGFIDFNVSSANGVVVDNILVSDVIVTPTEHPLNYWIPTADNNFIDNYVTLIAPSFNPNYYPYKASKESWREWSSTFIDWSAGNASELNIGDKICINGIITNLNNTEVPIKCIGIIAEKIGDEKLIISPNSKIIYGL